MTRRCVAAIGVAFLLMAAGCVRGVEPPLPPCLTEDSSDCYWDATVHGNGDGRSFIDRGGVVTFLD